MGHAGKGPQILALLQAYGATKASQLSAEQRIQFLTQARQL